MNASVSARSNTRIAQRSRRGKRGPNPVNALQLSLFDELIWIGEARAAIREQYGDKPAPLAVAICYRKLGEAHDRLRALNALVARLAA